MTCALSSLSGQVLWLPAQVAWGACCCLFVSPHQPSSMYASERVSICLQCGCLACLLAYPMPCVFGSELDCKSPIVCPRSTGIYPLGVCLKVDVPFASVCVTQCLCVCIYIYICICTSPCIAKASSNTYLFVCLKPHSQPKMS